MPQCNQCSRKSSSELSNPNAHFSWCSSISAAMRGDKVCCDGCGKEYIYFIWAVANNLKLCQACVDNRASAYLGSIDAVDLEAEHVLKFDDQLTEEAKEGNNSPSSKSN